MITSTPSGHLPDPGRLPRHPLPLPQDATRSLPPDTTAASLGAPQTPPAAGSSVPQPACQITVSVQRTDDPSSGELSIELHGAGTWEALILADILVEAEGRVVILDEPALTFHPTWQRAFRRQLRHAPGQFLVITHSAHLLPLEDKGDLARLVRIENESGAIQAHRLPSELLDDAGAITKFASELSLSTDAAALLFARGAVLLEGETELGLLPSWFAKADEGKKLPTPVDLDLAFFAVGSDTHFKIFVTLLHALAIPWVLICDGAAYDWQTRGLGAHIFRQVLDAGVDCPTLKAFLDQYAQQSMSSDLFDQAKALGEQHGIFTHAAGWQQGEESIEATLERVTPGKFGEAKEKVGEKKKVLQGRWLAENVACPSEFQCLYGKLVEFLGRQGLHAVPASPTRATAHAESTDATPPDAALGDTELPSPTPISVTATAPALAKP